MADLNLPTPLVSIDWLAAHLDHPDLVVLDAHMQPPSAPANTASVLQIPGARRFDFDKKICTPDTDLPHMLPSPELFSAEVQALGINARSLIVVYDRLGIFSAPRAWWMFRAMGHAQVAVLDGGLPAWQTAGLSVEPETAYAGACGDFVARLQPGLFCDADTVAAELSSGRRPVLDARSAARFAGLEPEPRAGLRTGHMPGALNLPFGQLQQGGKMKPVADLQAEFAPVLGEQQTPIFSCGSGVTACILALGAELAGYSGLTVYDGSWSEWGGDPKRPVVGSGATAASEDSVSDRDSSDLTEAPAL
jgi:thiosulfate/3-mercaptopyruvate sulfurtransferase